jgi:putative phage-type endonuclease
MSFGKLNLLINKIVKYLNQQDIELNFNNILTIKYDIFNSLKSKLNFNFITLDLIQEILNIYYTPIFKYNKIICFNDGNNCIREYEQLYDDISIPDEYKELENQFNKLKNLHQPIQRSKEWYEYRYNRITASDTGAAVGQNQYETIEKFIIKKCDPNFPFYDNKDVAHGKKYEDVAKNIYEHIYNTRVYEFGALPSEEYEFLGASPDGICSKYTLDNKFSNKLGTMLEIKCPSRRYIKTYGKINGDICKNYYYCQVQQQLICCNLNLCDFWQCKITEYPTREAYLIDECNDSVHTYNNNNNVKIENVKSNKIEINKKLKKGIILEFYPKKFIPEFENDNIEWKSKYIYPKRLDMDIYQYDSWVIKMLDQYKNLYPEIYENYYFHKIIYWKLNVSHNTPIYRNDEFFKLILPKLKDAWDKVLYYRNNIDKLKELSF